MGLAGFAVQVAALWILTSALRWPYLPSTIVAVELALLLNFGLHERWTWSDRPAAGAPGRLARFCRFHLLNGSVSMAGNVAVMAVLTGRFDVHPVLANAVGVGLCSAVNFAGSDLLVFRAGHSGADRRPAAGVA